MDNKSNGTISNFVHEMDMYRAERTKKRLLIALIVAMTIAVLAVGALVVNNHMWMQYVQTIETYQSE